MIVMEGSVSDAAVAAQLVDSAVDVVVHVERAPSGARRVVQVIEPSEGSGPVRALWDGQVLLNEPHRGRRSGVDFAGDTTRLGL